MYGWLGSSNCYPVIRIRPDETLVSYCVQLPEACWKMGAERNSKPAMEETGEERCRDYQVVPHEVEVMSIRAKRRLIAFCYHMGIVVFCVGLTEVGALMGNAVMPEVAGAIILADILTFRIIPLSKKLQELLIPEAVCFGCGTVISLLGIYRDGCGYQSHKERHVFSPCPMCGKYFSWITCPVCETSIPI
ncbi:MAG: hypothetical protein ACYDFU_00675 [Nitrospirota bacterium]